MLIRLIRSMLIAVCCVGWGVQILPATDQRPNILLAISDDQSYPYASAYGCSGVSTPAFDRVAKEGVLFTSAYAASPGCSPCRAALLTGRHCWQIEQAGTHDSSFPIKYRTYPELLAGQGYFVGHTGKGWGPGNFKEDGRKDNPAGPAFSSLSTKPPYSGIAGTDYAANFDAFLKQRPAGQPFCFWYGGKEPHRAYQAGSGLKSGKQLADAVVPPFLPDDDLVRSDILDYCVEIEWFDRHLGRMLQSLEAAGELDNTLVIVTSDDGMPFPRAKANGYDAGVHVPLAIRWGNKAPGGRTVDDLVGFVDLSATILDACGVDLKDAAFQQPERRLAGQSLVPLLQVEGSGVLEPRRAAVFSSRERHSSSRYLNLGYPIRSMRTPEYLCVWNFRPDRWPAGAPQRYENDSPGAELAAQHAAYHDIDACPTLSHLVKERDNPQVSRFFHLAIDKRPEFEVFDVRQDPGCLANLAGTVAFAGTEAKLRHQFEQALRETGDPRVVNSDGGDVFETYPRYSAARRFPETPEARAECERREAEGWVRLFDGETLAGWKAAGPAGSFEVVNGSIQAKATADQAHLFYVGPDGNADFRDFELLIDCLSTPGSNGGIYFHTSWQETGFPNDGHEVQVNSSHVNKTRSGSLFSVVNLAESPVPDNVFYTEHVTVRGKHVTIAVNGQKVVDYTEPSDYSHPKYTGRNVDHGTFALQAHDPESTTFYRNIWVRPLK
jgi:N-sulfoglucosamine sulfohydrolase